MKTKTYAEKLKDPRWQQKRLVILERDSFECQICRDASITLHVHHLNYEKGKDPWDSDNDDLVTLCEHCHNEAHLNCLYINNYANYILQDRPITHKYISNDGNGYILLYQNDWSIMLSCWHNGKNIMLISLAEIGEMVSVAKLIMDTAANLHYYTEACLRKDNISG